MNEVATQRINRTLKTLVFCSLLLVMLWSLDFVMKPASGTVNPWPAERATRGEIDVIAAGSSRTYCTIMPMELWRESGITALDLTAAVQPVSVTLGYLRRVFVTQKPDVVMVELYMFGQEASFDLIEAHNSIDHMPADPNRIMTTLRSVEPTAWVDVLVPLHMYHGRWREITSWDLDPAKHTSTAYARGAMYLPEAAPVPTAVDYTDIRKEAYARDLAYLRSIARLCESNSARLVVFSSPSRWQQVAGGVPLLDRLRADMATEFPAVGYMDMHEVAEQIGVSAETDYKDELHVNHRGAVKISKWLARYLAEEYHVRDRREESLATRWNADLETYDSVFKAVW